MQCDNVQAQCEHIVMWQCEICQHRRQNIFSTPVGAEASEHFADTLTTIGQSYMIFEKILTTIWLGYSIFG